MAIEYRVIQSNRVSAIYYILAIYLTWQPKYFKQIIRNIFFHQNLDLFAWSAFPSQVIKQQIYCTDLDLAICWQKWAFDGFSK